MKARFGLYGLGICAVAALFLLPRPETKIEIDQFSWKVDGKAAPFEFWIHNLTGEEVIVDIVVLAQSKSEDYDGTTITEEGREKLEVVLGPNERTKINGVVYLVRFGTAGLSLYPFASIRGPNQAPEINTG